MIKSKNIDLIDRNRNQLFEYLSDFTDDLRSKIIPLFEDDDFNCGYYVFLCKMRARLSMPKIGKQTKKYWICRGWSDEESETMRIKMKMDPTSSPMNINHWVNKGLSLDESLFKIRSMRKLNKEYWMVRGFEEPEAIKKVSEFQMVNSGILHDKYKMILILGIKLEKNRILV